MSDGLNMMVDEMRRRHREFEETLSAEHFADPDATIPDLDFRPPDCPICTRETFFDDGQFCCEVCHIWWPSDGQGRNATREIDP